MKKLFLVTTCVLMLAGLGFAMACSDDEPSDEEARATLCADLQQLGVAVDGFMQLTNQSTIGEIKAARDDVGDAVSSVDDSAKDVSDAQTADLQQAYDDFNQTVDGITDDQTAQQALDAVSASAQALGTAHEQLASDLACAAGNTPTEAATETPAVTPAETPAETPAAAETPTTEAAVPTESGASTEPAASPTP